MNTFNLKLDFPNLLWEIAGYNFPSLFGKWAILFIFIAISFQVSAQRMAIKTNTLEWLAASPNLGVEFPLNDWMTAEISASANPWKITDKLFYRHGRVQAEAKYWLRNLLARHYIGITGFYSMFDVGINRRAIVIVIAITCTSILNTFRGLSSRSRASVNSVGEVV